MAQSISTLHQYSFFYFISLFLHFIVHESGSTLSTVVTITVLSHEASNSSNRTVLPQPDHLSVCLDAVILEGLESNSLGATLNLLWLGVNLLLTLLSASAKTKYQMQGGLLLDVVVRQGTSVLELLSGKDQTLLIWRNSFLVLDLSLDIVNGV